MAINFIIPIFKKIVVERCAYKAVLGRIDSIVYSIVASSLRKNPVMKRIAILHLLLCYSIIYLVQSTILEVRDMWVR